MQRPVRVSLLRAITGAPFESERHPPMVPRLTPTGRPPNPQAEFAPSIKYICGVIEADETRRERPFYRHNRLVNALMHQKEQSTDDRRRDAQQA